jgi:ankyrin repeat protein
MESNKFIDLILNNDLVKVEKILIDGYNVFTEDEDIEIDKQDSDGNTVLILAASNGLSKMVKLLYFYGADIFIFNNDCMTALKVATVKFNVTTSKNPNNIDEYSNIIKYLTEAQECSLINACGSVCSLDSVKKALMFGHVDINRRNENGRTALSIKVRGHISNDDDVSIVRLLLAHGADPLSVDNDGRNAINYIYKNMMELYPIRTNYPDTYEKLVNINIMLQKHC